MFVSEDEQLCNIAESAVTNGNFVIKVFGVPDPAQCKHNVYWEVKVERSDIDKLQVEATREK